MNGVYSPDKPKDCRYCYYYGKHNCTLGQCHYLALKKKKRARSECMDCPYGKNSPCIGWCTKELLRSMERGREK